MVRVDTAETGSHAGTGGQLRFDGRVAVVTGGGRGLGRRYCEFLAARGASVVVADCGVDTAGKNPTFQPAWDVVEAIGAAGGEAVASIQDVSTEAGADEIVATSIATFGRLDIVVNNAGIYQTHQFANHPLELFQRHLAVHVVGSFNITRAAWPHLASYGTGRVLMTTSGAWYGLPQHVAYSTAKAAVVGLTRALAIDGIDCGVMVNAVAPLAVTRMTAVGRGAEGLVQASEPIDKDDSVDFPANLVAYLVHQSCHVTGQTYFVGSDRVAHMYMGETRGAVDSKMTPEKLRDAWGAVNSTAGAHVVEDVADWFAFHRSIVGPGSESP